MEGMDCEFCGVLLQCMRWSGIWRWRRLSGTWLEQQAGGMREASTGGSCRALGTICFSAMHEVVKDMEVEAAAAW